MKPKTIREVLLDVFIEGYSHIDQAEKDIKEIMLGMLPKEKEFDKKIGYDAETNIKCIVEYNRAIEEMKKKIEEVCNEK